MISSNIWNVIGRHTDKNVFLEKKLSFERKINDPGTNLVQTKNFVGFLDKKCLKIYWKS